jgi:signal transduction histidine kinase/ligand-binding sensor domain-containing protein
MLSYHCSAMAGAWIVSRVMEVRRNKSFGSAGIAAIAIVLFLAVTVSSSTHAALPAAEYLVKNLTSADGLPENTVRAIVQSSHGYLWIGTVNGIARFDGQRFVSLDRFTNPELISDDVWSMHEARDGSLWIATPRGLICYSGGRFKTILDGKNGSPINASGFAEEADGTIWALGPSLLRLHGMEVEVVSSPENGPDSWLDACGAVNGGLLIGSRNGLWRRRNNLYERVSSVVGPQLIDQTTDGRIFGLRNETQLVVLEEGNWRVVHDFEGLRCRTLTALPNGDLWIGAASLPYAYRLRGTELTEIGPSQGLEGNRVICFEQDRENNVWIGVNGGGLFRLREKRLRLFNRSSGFDNLSLSSVCQDAAGNIWASVMGWNFYRLTNGAFRPQSLAPKNERYPTGLLASHNGGIWVGSFYGPLRRFYEDKIVETIGSSNGTRSLCADRDGNLWRGTRTAGIEYYGGKTVRQFSTEDGLSDKNVYCFAQDRDGAMWAGTEQGLNRIKDGQIQRFGRTNGLGHDFISSLCVDSQGTLWVATLGGGLSAWNGERFSTLSVSQGLLHDTVEQLIEDDLDHLWIGTRAGIMRVKLDVLHECLTGKTPTFTGEIFGREDGLVRPDSWTEYQPAWIKANDGKLWMCTRSGLVTIDPSTLKNAPVAPLIRLEDARLDGKSLFNLTPPKDEIELPPGGDRLEIRYAAVNFSSPDSTRYRYLLSGYDKNWIEAGRARVAIYSHLPPARYSFQVMAVNNGIASAAPAVLTLIVHPAFWQTHLFRSAVLLALGLMLLVLYRARIGRLEARRLAQEDFSRRLIDSQEQERKRIAGELHDSLGQNLLVIKNRAALALNQKDHPEKMVAQLTEVSSMASASIREVREIAQNLRPFQIDELGLRQAIVAMVKKMSESSDIQIGVAIDDMDEFISQRYGITLYRIVQESLNNIVKHAGARSALVKLFIADGAVHLVITDDGKGFVRNPKTEIGFGLRSIEERARAVGGVATIKSGPGQGARLEVVFSLK